MRRLLYLSVAAALAGCATPPKPPTVDGSNRQAINDQATAEVLAMRARLAEAREQLDEARKDVERARAAMLETHDQLSQRGRKVKPEPARFQRAEESADSPPVNSTVFRYQFGFNSAALTLTETQKAELLPKAHNADRIEIRGRTDGQTPSAGDEAIAKARALSARALLVANGVSPQKMAINYVSAGDYITDNYSPAGRSQNRRVEIEVIQQLKRN